jgi:hypothetical protein
MAIVSNAPGSQVVLADGKRITRKAQIATANERMSPPGGDGQLTSIQITDDIAGVRRGFWEYTQSSLSPGGQEIPGSGPGVVVELMGGSREVPIQTHPKFKNIDAKRIKQITRAVDAEDDSLLPNPLTGDENNLVEFLRREIKYFLAPAVTGRVTTLESGLPSLGDLLKLGGASQLPSAPSNSKWILTGISARTSGDKYEVSKEYTLLGDGADAANFLYG